MKNKKNSTFWFLFLIGFILFTEHSLINVAWISSGSMLPKYKVDNRLVSNQLTWGLNIPFMDQQLIQWQQPQRGEIVLFHNPYDEGHIWMKRVIGLAGDSILYRNHQLYVNGQLCSSDQRNIEKLPLGHGTFTPEYRLWTSYLEQDWGPITVPDGELFLMGDHRGASIDSRTWGTVPIRYLTGKPMLRIWPLSKIEWLP